MFHRRRLSLAITLVGCLLVASGASADPLDTFTATSAPTKVKASTSATYTISMTSDLGAPNRAHRAKIGIPGGFVVTAGSVQAATSASGSCQAATWVADGELIANGKINLARPGDDTTALCPGATLTVVFVAVSASADGTYSWTTELSNDVAGAFTLTGSQPSVVVDGTAPSVTVSGPPNPTNATSATFAFTASEPSTFRCKLDAGAFVACTSPQGYTGLASGSHTFAVEATESVGNVGQTSYSWTIDTTPPTVTMSSNPPNLTNSISASFAFTATEASTFQCKLDASPFEPCTSPKGYTALAGGSHTFHVKATDTAGNAGPETTFTWTIDTTAPTVTMSSNPPSPTNSISASFAFTATEASTFQCKLDASPFELCTSPKGYTALASGAHTFHVKATDTAGNAGPETTFAWTIDTTAPTVTITGKPPNPTNATSASFAFTASEPSTFRCKLDAGAFVACTSPQGYTGLASGSHTFTVEATDALGNAGVGSDTWTIDAAAPTASITGKPSNPSNVQSPTFAFTANEASTFRCKLDGAAFASCASPKTYTLADDGSHTFAVVATDTVGNVGTTVSYTWTIDTLAPATTITLKPSNPSNTSSPSFTFTASESGSFTCRLDGGSFASCTSPTTFSNLADGPHTFAARATDAAGNTGADAIHTWTIETRAPTAALTSVPSALSNSSTASFAFSADEPSSFDCSLDDRAYEPCSSPLSYHGLVDGQHTFTVRARDAVGNLSPRVSHSWTIDTTAPETTLASVPKSGTTATSAAFTFSATESGTFECRLDGAPFAVCGSPKTFDGLGQGEHRFEVRAIDAAGNADATPSRHAWTIQAAARTIPSSALVAPRSGARVTKPPLLVWRGIARAGYYNVQVFRGKQKVLSAWPTRARLRLRTRWKFAGRVRQLTPGAYRWYVWPGYGAPSARRYGELLGQSTFVVARSVRR